MKTKIQEKKERKVRWAKVGSRWGNKPGEDGQADKGKERQISK